MKSEAPQDPSAIRLESVRERVQQACTSNYTGVVRVTIVGDVGYWYFRRGMILHATTLELQGDQAALRMLGWGGCQWESCNRPWPLEQSVFLSWVELFQRAAELPAQEITWPAPTVQPAPASVRPAPASVRPAPAVRPPPRLSDFSGPTPRVPLLRSLGPARPTPPAEPMPLETLAGLAADFVAMDESGRTQLGRGESEQLSELANFSWQLADNLGSLIGAGQFMSLEVSYRDHSLVLGRSGATKVALTVAREGEVERIKSALRL